MRSMPPQALTLMNNAPRRSVRDHVGEGLRYLTGWILALMMLIPALLITIADKITSWHLRRRGGRD